VVCRIQGVGFRVEGLDPCRTSKVLRERERERMCVCERERDKERVCVCERERMCV